MADKKYIEVGELKEWIENFFEVVHYYHPYSKSRTLPESELFDILERMPAADVGEVVRCKDCRYAIKIKDTEIPGYYLCRAETNPNYKSANSFCDVGERKENKKR